MEVYVSATPRGRFSAAGIPVYEGALKADKFLVIAHRTGDVAASRDYALGMKERQHCGAEEHIFEERSRL